MTRNTKIPKYCQTQNITTSQWTDWRWQLAHTISDAQTLANIFALSEKEKNNIDQVIENKYAGNADAMRITPYLASIMTPGDAIWQQFVPNIEEIEPDDFIFENIWENDTDFTNKDNKLIQQKYPDAILLRLANTCHAFCRFCFQKKRTLRQGAPAKINVDEIITAITSKPSVYQIVISGGDPLIYQDNFLFPLIEKITSIPQISLVRINTRSLLTNPYRITPEFANGLVTIQQNSWAKKERGVNIEIGLHFNHPDELTPKTLEAIRLLKKSGISLYNQSVLLRNINDSATILANLFRILRKENVRLHYLSQAMTVPRTGHFRTRVRDGQKIIQELEQTGEFRGQLPHFELSHYTGKQIIPTTMNKNFLEEKIKQNGKNISAIKFFSSITHKWEIFPDGK